MPSKGPNPRRSNGSARTKLREAVRAEGLPCGICGMPIDYSLPAGDPMCYELDEIVPVSKGGSPYERANVQPAHRICNQRKGNRTGGGPAGAPDCPNADMFPLSRDWAAHAARERPQNRFQG